MLTRAARQKAPCMFYACPHCRSVKKYQGVAPARAFKYEPSLAPVEKPTVRVRLSVPFRVPKRQMLCVGGDKLPFGWSFMSIAHVPMTWNPGDVWTVEVDLELGERIQYKYVILEEQEWTKLENPSAEGVVKRHRSGSQPESPPDNHTIQMKMAIVSWQPGPNRVLQVPNQDELDSLKHGSKTTREPARPRIDFTEVEGQRVELPDISLGTTEALTCTKEGDVFLDRRDVWAADGWDEDPLLFRRP